MGGSPSDVLSRFLIQLNDSGIERVAGGTTYWLHQHLGDDLYWSVELRTRTGLPGSVSTTALQTARISRIVSVKADNDAAVTFNGAGWSARTVGTSTFGGFYRRSSTAGNYVECVTGAGVTVLGVMTFANNAGVMKVEIDGDATLANLVTTAQQLVDSGALPSTVLVANGGTLNPTDRCFDQSTLGTAGLIVLADNLSAGIHTLRLTVTGYKNTASTDVRIYFSGFFFNAPAGTRLSESAIATIPVTTLLSTLSVWEYALNCLPDGEVAGGSTFIGNGHGYDIQTALTFEADGLTITPAEWDVDAGVIEVTRITELRHPTSGTNKIADVQMVYTMHPTSGLTTDLTLEWVIAGVCTIAYVSMMPGQQSPFDKGSLFAATQDYTLTNDNDSQAVNLQDSLAYMWDADGDYGAMVHYPDVATAIANWQYTNVFLWIQDRSNEGGSLINKVYLTRVSGTEPLSNGLVWTCRSNYRTQRFAQGADTALAR